MSILLSSALYSSWALPDYQAQVGADATAFPFNSNGYGEQVFPSVGGRIVVQKENQYFEFKTDAFARVFVSRGTPFYFNAPEAYVATKPTLLAPTTLTFGRKLHTWSSVDETFYTGIWQPRFRWDPVAPESVGLLGLFANVDLGVLQIKAFGSPIFIPEAGMPVNFEAGSITSPSPFGMSGISSATLFGTTTPIRYDLQIPAIDRVVLNPSFSVQAHLGAPSVQRFAPVAQFDPQPESRKPEGAWFSTGYAFKPLNQLLMVYNYGLRVDVNGPGGAPYALIPLQVRVGYHHLVSTEMGYETKHLGLWASGLGEVPVGLPPVEGWTYQVVTPSVAAALNAEYRFGSAQSFSPRLRLSFLQQVGGNAPDANPPPPSGMALSSTGSNFEFRYPFQRAVQAQAWSPLPLLPRLFVQQRVLYDIGNDGILASTGLTWLPTQDWAVGLSGDFFVTGITRYTGDRPSDFIGQYYRNSRIQGGVSYVF